LNKYHEIIIILAFVGFILASLKLAYGQSLAKLQSQVNIETGYRTELEGYINLHNISFSAAKGDNHLNISDFDVFDLETLIKLHMEFCQSKNNVDERIRSKQIRGTEWAIRVDK
jgi:hypothetical protein